MGLTDPTQPEYLLGGPIPPANIGRQWRRVAARRSLLSHWMGREIAVLAVLEDVQEIPTAEKVLISSSNASRLCQLVIYQQVDTRVPAEPF